MAQQKNIKGLTLSEETLQEYLAAKVREAVTEPRRVDRDLPGPRGEQLSAGRFRQSVGAG